MKNDLIVTAETAFKYYDSDKVAKKVADRYFELLICGIANIAHIFQPQVVVLGGELSLSSISFLKAIEKRINDLIPFPIILTAAQTGNEAGLIGATLSGEKL